MEKRPTLYRSTKNLIRFIFCTGGCSRNRKISFVVAFLIASICAFPEYFFGAERDSSDLLFPFNILSSPTPTTTTVTLNTTVDPQVQKEIDLQQHFKNQHQNTTIATTKTTPIIVEDNSLSFEKPDKISTEEPKIAIEMLNEEHTIFSDHLLRRKNLLESGCGGMTPLDITLAWQPTRWFLVDVEHKLLACIPPSEDEQIYHQYFYKLREYSKNPGSEINVSPNAQEENKLVLDMLPLETANVLLTERNALRFLVVEHPFVRLLQLWKRLFNKKNPEGKELMEQYPYMNDFVSHAVDDIEEIIDFRDFVEYVSRKKY